jgi:hypothetical protein
MEPPDDPDQRKADMLSCPRWILHSLHTERTTKKDLDHQVLQLRLENQQITTQLLTKDQLIEKLNSAVSKCKELIQKKSQEDVNLKSQYQEELERIVSQNAHMFRYYPRLTSLILQKQHLQQSEANRAQLSVQVEEQTRQIEQLNQQLTLGQRQDSEKLIELQLDNDTLKHELEAKVRTFSIES